MAKPSTKTTGLAPGRYLALTAAQLKTLRGAKGDRARRDHVADLARKKACATLDVGDTWFFLKYLGGLELAIGKGLHKGQMKRIELLDPATLAGALATLGELDLKKAFFGIDEAEFRDSVPFWVLDQWKNEGRKTVLDAHVFGRVKTAVSKLGPFVTSAAAGGKHVLFSTSF